jgi:dTDP-4-amino-4,6-dideoxygalactose transaminase
MMIEFNKPFVAKNEEQYVIEAIAKGDIAGDRGYTKKCQAYFESRWMFAKAMMTTSCTDALEMAALLLDIKPGDEVIVPSYTFVSTVNAFALRGAKIIFVDSEVGHPNIDVAKIEEKITKRTRVILPVHYAGNACKMDTLMQYARHFKLLVVEDAAQAINSFFIDDSKVLLPLGSLGTFGTFSFHESKNITCGEGGLLAINDTAYVERAEFMWEKGTNRNEYLRGEVDKYEWVDLGSSFLPSDMLSAFLFGQLECLDEIQDRRKAIWESYHTSLKQLENGGHFRLPEVPPYSTNNAHIFYLVCNSIAETTGLYKFLKAKGIETSFHYQSLHRSRYYLSNNKERVELPNCDRFANQLLRLPLHCSLSQEDIYKVVDEINNYYRSI